MSDDVNTAIKPDRRPVHVRRIVCEAYERNDALIDFEATLTDTKPFPMVLPEREVAADQPIHRMMVRLAVDQDCVIREAEARTFDSPYRICGSIAPAYERLLGLVVGPGFSREVKVRFRGVLGCTHLTELLPIIATTVFQTLWSDNNRFERGETTTQKDHFSAFGSCHALKYDGEIVRKDFPDLYGKGPGA